MALPQLFSRRKRAAANVADVYQYTVMTSKLREQVSQIIFENNRALKNGYSSNSVLEDVVLLMRKELGVPTLSAEYQVADELYRFLREHNNVDEVIDTIEVAVSFISYTANSLSTSCNVNAMVEELNARFLEAGFGYQIEDNQILQIDTEYTHKEIVIPALNLLSDTKFNVANAEFRKAFDEFRSGDYEDSIHDCANALESTLKTILHDKGWAYKENDTASKLLAAVFDNNLIPNYMQAQFTSLRSMLESSTPTLRNKSGGHGAGHNPRNIPSYIASFQLHQTAAALVLLVSAAK